MQNNLAFDHVYRVMGATQQLMVRSLINLIEMISTSSHRYAQDNSAFTDEAMSLMKKAAATRGPESLRDLQKEWAQTCMKFSQSQTRATMGFVEQFGQQVLGTIAANPFTPPMGDVAEPEAAAAPAPKAQPTPKAPPKKPAPKTPVAKTVAAPKTVPAKATPIKASLAKTTVARATKPKAAPKASSPKALSKASLKTPGKNSTNAEKS